MKKTLQKQPSLQKPKKTIAGLYDLEETLGRGHFAVVKAARHVFTGERVAVKVIDKSKLDAVAQKALLREVLCMKLVQHRNVVRLYEVIDTAGKLFLVLELGKGDLFDLIGRGLSEDLTRKYFVQIFQAVAYCHKLHVVHRDLKPENVVFFEDSLGVVVKLTDFGFSNNYTPGHKLDTSCGSLAYSAPEILLGDAYDAPAVDTWSLGVLLFTLATGHPPFSEANDSETLTKIMDVKYNFPPNFPPGARDLVTKMLVKKPEERIKISEIEEHAWVKGHLELEEKLLFESVELTEEEKEEIYNEMVKGGVVNGGEEVESSLATNAYNHITSTYYILAERLLKQRGEKVQATTGSLESLKEEAAPLPKPKKKFFLFNLFKRHSLTSSNNNNRIYKTRSCSELKIKAVN